jgi:hypothetical protein
VLQSRTHFLHIIVAQRSRSRDSLDAWMAVSVGATSVLARHQMMAILRQALALELTVTAYPCIINDDRNVTVLTSLQEHPKNLENWWIFP